jgi:5-deoxy-glucuronate isomerase
MDLAQVHCFHSAPRLLCAAGVLPRDAWSLAMSELLIRPEVFRERIADFGFEFLSFQARRLGAGEAFCGETDYGGVSRELAIVVLAGACSVASSRGEWKSFGKRATVFEGMPYALYLPVHTRFTVTAESGCDLAFCYAKAEQEFDPQLVTPEMVGIEIRGGGNATRQIHDIIPPSFAAHRLIVVEVFTPSGNWSSYPPHKHDRDALPDESYLEETYYHRLKPAQGFALQRIYTDDRSLDETLAVGDGDVVLVPKGYHPVGAPHGYDLYYLNVMAGPKRIWRFHNDPAHEWLMKQPAAL